MESEFSTDAIVMQRKAHWERVCRQRTPEQCSGLPVVRYSPHALAAFLGEDYTLEEDRHVVHHTPWDSEQRFVYCRFRYQPEAV